MTTLAGKPRRRPADGMRLWFQALVPKDDDSDAYYRSMATHVAAVSRPGTTVTLHGMPRSLLPDGMTIASFAGQAASAPLQDLFIGSRVLRAEKKGYDAFLISPLHAPGLETARTLTDLPVVSYPQAVAATGSCIGGRPGVVGFNPPMLPLFADRVSGWLPRPCVGWEDIALDYPAITGLFEPSASLDPVIAACRRLIGRGADVIVPGQMILAEALWARGFHRIDGVPVIDAMGSLVLLAESLVILRRHSGLGATRTGWRWSAASSDVRRLVESFGGEG